MPFSKWLPLCLALPLIAQTTLPEGNYNPRITHPEQALGYAAGEDFTPHHRLLAYYHDLEKQTDRLKILPYGATYEGRLLALLAFSSPQNLARLPAVQSAMQALADPRKTTPERARDLQADLPAVLWLSYGVHGNETSSSEAALLVAYYLAARQDPEIEEWLRRAVVLLDPLVNPDGRERYVNFYRQSRGLRPNPDRAAAEHQEPWPGGRTNHYLFDLNRDLAWQTQQENRGRARAFLEWRPLVHVDYHEMAPDSSYFFPPTAKPIGEHVPPHILAWFKVFGQANAAVFDKQGWRYFTREGFDLYYPSYADSWPALHGSVGMTYEQAGGGGAGLVIKLPDERLVTLRDRVARHFHTSLATIRTGVANRENLLAEYYDHRRRTLSAAGARQFYILPAPDPARVSEFVDLLLRQDISVGRATASFRVAAHDYFAGATAEREFPAGTLVIDSAQPSRAMVETLLEPDPKIQDLFFYDVTSWSLPVAMGLEAFWGEQKAGAKLEPLSAAPAVNRPAVSPAGSAYLVPWTSNNAARLVGALLSEGFRGGVSLKSLRVADHSFAPGTVVIPVEGNQSGVAKRMADLAAESGAEVVTVATQLAQEGVDLGSRYVHPLRRPRLAVVMDRPVAASGYGAIWYLLDQRYHLPFTALRASTLGSVDLRDYNVLVLPDDGEHGRGYAGVIAGPTLNRLRDWISAGNTLIAIKGAAVFATQKRSGLTSVTHKFLSFEEEQRRLEEEQRAAQPPSAPGQAPVSPGAPPAAAPPAPPDVDLARKLLPYGDREQRERSEQIPGATARLALDPTHPLGFGFSSQVCVLNRNSAIFSLTAKGENIAYYPRERFRVGGFLTPDSEKKLPLTAYLIREPLGRGQVILFADEPGFRAFWSGNERLLLNAILFGDVSHAGAAVTPLAAPL